jgi:hypothetical protein
VRGTWPPLALATSRGVRTPSPVASVRRALSAGHAGGGGVDIQPLCDAGVPCAGLAVSNGARADRTDSYFYYHHTRADTVTHIRREEVNACVARCVAPRAGVPCRGLRRFLTLSGATAWPRGRTPWPTCQSCSRVARPSAMWPRCTRLSPHRIWTWTHTRRMNRGHTEISHWGTFLQVVDRGRARDTPPPRPAAR